MKIYNVSWCDLTSDDSGCCWSTFDKKEALGWFDWLAAQGFDVQFWVA